MEITGRIAGDAQVKKTKDGRELVAFTIVINDHYKTKAGEKKDETTFINCSYWVSTKITAILKKSSIVTVTGSIGINAYKKNDGEFYAHLTFHCNYINLIGSVKNTIEPNGGGITNVGKPKDDLPF